MLSHSEALGELGRQTWLASPSSFSRITLETPSAEHTHLVAELKLLRNLCEGRMQIQGLLSFVEEVAPCNAVLLMVFDPSLPSDIRAGALGVFHETHLDTPGACIMTLAGARR